MEEKSCLKIVIDPSFFNQAMEMVNIREENLVEKKEAFTERNSIEYPDKLPEELKETIIKTLKDYFSGVANDIKKIKNEVLREGFQFDRQDNTEIERNKTYFFKGFKFTPSFNAYRFHLRTMGIDNKKVVEFILAILLQTRGALVFKYVPVLIYIPRALSSSADAEKQINIPTNLKNYEGIPLSLEYDKISKKIYIKYDEVVTIGIKAPLFIGRAQFTLAVTDTLGVELREFNLILDSPESIGYKYSSKLVKSYADVFKELFEKLQNANLASLKTPIGEEALIEVKQTPLTPTSTPNSYSVHPGLERTTSESHFQTFENPVLERTASASHFQAFGNPGLQRTISESHFHPVESPKKTSDFQPGKSFISFFKSILNSSPVKSVVTNSPLAQLLKCKAHVFEWSLSGDVNYTIQMLRDDEVKSLFAKP